MSERQCENVSEWVRVRVGRCVVGGVGCCSRWRFFNFWRFFVIPVRSYSSQLYILCTCMYIQTLYRHNVQHVRLVQYDHTVAVLYVCPVVLYIVCTVHGLPACTVHYVVCCIYSYSYSYSIYFVAYILCKHCLCIVKNCMCCIALPARLYLCSYTVCTSTLLNGNRGVLQGWSYDRSVDWFSLLREKRQTASKLWKESEIDSQSQLLQRNAEKWQKTLVDVNVLRVSL